MAADSIVLMRALVKASFVRTLTWWPKRERAEPPSAWIAIDVRAAVTCSPVAATASISRASGTFAISWARARSRLVSPLIALTTRTTRLPARWVAMARRATLRMRSTEPTEVPPYFWTTRGAWYTGTGVRLGTGRRDLVNRGFTVARVHDLPGASVRSLASLERQAD